MDNNNWRPIQGAEPSMETTDWRTQLQPDSRQRIVNKIMDTLKKHLSNSAQEGLHELKKNAERFEERIFRDAVSQSDYLRKISVKILTFETKAQIPNPSTPEQVGPTSQGPGVNKKRDLSYRERKADSRKKKRKLPDTIVVNRMVAEKARLAEVERQLAMLQADFATERRLNQKRLESLESMAGDAILCTRAELMQEFKDGKHDEWDPDHCIQLWRRRREEMAMEAVAP